MTTRHYWSVSWTKAERWLKINHQNIWVRWISNDCKKKVRCLLAHIQTAESRQYVLACPISLCVVKIPEVEVHCLSSTPRSGHNVLLLAIQIFKLQAGPNTWVCEMSEKWRTWFLAFGSLIQSEAIYQSSKEQLCLSSMERTFLPSGVSD